MSPRDPHVLDLRNKPANKNLVPIRTKSPINVKYIASAERGNVEVLAINSWTRDQYERLRTSWGRYNIAIPKYSQLVGKIKKAHQIIREVTSSRPELKLKMGLLLVPPQKYLEFPVSNNLRRLQKFVEHGDYLEVNPNFDNPVKDWRLMVADVALSGVSWGSPTRIIAKNLYQVAGYDTLGMGPIEYSALTLQHSHIIDRGTPTLLLKEYDKGGLIFSARFSRGRYCFLFENAVSVFSDYRYRPTIEVLD